MLPRDKNWTWRKLPAEWVAEVPSFRRAIPTFWTSSHRDFVSSRLWVRFASELHRNWGPLGTLHVDGRLAIDLDRLAYQHSNYIRVR